MYNEWLKNFRWWVSLWVDKELATQIATNYNQEHSPSIVPTDRIRCYYNEN